MRQESQVSHFGQQLKTDFFDNVGGTNLSDSVFKIADNQAAGGFNFDYALTGGFNKRLGPLLINSSPNAQLQSLGLGLYNTASGVKSVIRAAGTKLQYFDTATPSFTNLSEDTVAAGTSPLVSGSTQTVQFSQFNNGSASVLWAAGGGMTIPYGVYSTSKITKNGVDAPTASVFTATSGAGSSSLSTGIYRYSLVYRKASTLSKSNAVLEASVSVTATNNVTLAWTLSNLDTTKYDQILVYRSALNGSTLFTTGDLVVTLANSATGYVDTGTSEASSVTVPRADSTILDNSALPAGTYNSIAVFKRRLVVASNSTLYFSDLNKSESWPTVNTIQVPSGGNITGLAVISFTSPQAQTLDELLVVFKEREVWVVTGTSISDWALKFIDQVGCPDQGLIVAANGFLAWIDFRGIYLWDGTSKPIYCSRMIEPLFAKDGDLDKTKFVQGTAEFFRRESQIIWYLSSKTYGTQKFALKMDLRLTLPQIEQQLTGRNIDAVLIQDTYQLPIYAALSYIPSGGSEEKMVLGDDNGYCYYGSGGFADGSANYSFTYRTRPLDMGDPNTKKTFYQVIVWVEELGTWNLTLDYWSDYTIDPSKMASKSLPITSINQNSAALFDIAYFDVAYFDTYNTNLVPIIFNLEPGTANSNTGSAIQLQFRNDTKNQPISIHGFTVVWGSLGGVTA